MFVVSVALAQTASDLGDPLPERGADTVELTASLDAGRDVLLVVERDGRVVAPAAPPAEPVEQWLTAQLAARPGARVVVQADPGATYDAVLGAADLAARLGGAPALARTTLWAPGAETLGDAASVEALGDLSRRDRRRLAPRHTRFPLDPYQNTSSYTAYTLDWGESRLGLGSLSVGVLPRVQVGTQPVLDVLGAFNAQAKVNLTREGRFDAAVSAQYYAIPISNVIELAGADELLSGVQGLTDTARADYLGLGAGASYRITDPWSVHAQVYWARPSARGEISFDSLPEVLLPGLSLGDSGAIGLGVSGDLFVLNAATDLRFNPRDSLYLWARWPFYGRVRGQTSASVGGFEELENADFMVAYGQFLDPSASLSVAAGYRASFRHLEARVGIGWSAVPYTWLMQAFELSYRFGGPDRREQRQIRRGFRDVPEEQRASADEDRTSG